MRALIFIGLVVGFCFASGGDTIKYTADVKNLKDGDNFYSDIHYHSMKDSIAKIVNGRLGNINIANDAEIDLSKLDTTGSMKFNTLTTDKHTSDTVIADTAKVTGLNAVRATIDSSKIRKIDADSGSFSVLKGHTTKRDSTTFTGGAYFAGIGRFAGTLYAPVADIDSLVGDIKIGGNVRGYGNCAFGGAPKSITDYNVATVNGTNLGAAISLGCRDTSYLIMFGRKVGTERLADIYASDSAVIRFFTNNTLRASIDNGGLFTINGPLTTSTLNTGNGDNELYPMNQDVRTTASPTFVNVTSNLTGNVTGTADSAKKAGTATYLSGGTVNATTGTFSGTVSGATFNSGLGATEIPLYSSGSFTITLYENDTNRANATAYWQRIGSVVTLLIPQLLGSLSGSDVTLTGLPSEILPYSYQNFTVVLYSNDAIVEGTMTFITNTNHIDVNKIDGSDLASGSGGLPGGTSITYFVN